MAQHKKTKRRKKHGKYAEEHGRMDYEGGNYGNPDSSRKPDEIEGVPVKGKNPDTNDTPSKRWNDSSGRRQEP